MSLINNDRSSGIAKEAQLFPAERPPFSACGSVEFLNARDEHPTFGRIRIRGGPETADGERFTEAGIAVPQINPHFPKCLNCLFT